MYRLVIKNLIKKIRTLETVLDRNMNVVALCRLILTGFFLFFSVQAALQSPV